MDADRLRATTIPLLDDLTRCLEELTRAAKTGELDQFWGRTFIRSLFSVVEATTNEMKTLLLEQGRAGRFMLSDGEAAALRDFTYEIDQDGKLLTRSRFIATERQFRFVFSLLPRIFGEAATLPVGNDRFARFRRALRVRNRLTHPKSSADVSVSAAEVQDGIAGFLWFKDVMLPILDRWTEIIKSDVSA